MERYEYGLYTIYIHFVLLLRTSFLSHFSHYSLKLECEKLASEKIEIQRHYVMVSIHSFLSLLSLVPFIRPTTK
jgi:hypothetical protein